MTIFEQVIQFLGKSERDDAFNLFLKEQSIPVPLKRPPRGEDQVNVLLKNVPIELCFVTSESLPAKQGLLEGELVLHSVFLERNKLIENEELLREIPLRLSIDMSRKHVRDLLGLPVWSSPVLNNDRWIINGVRVLVCFSDDESIIQQISFSLPQ